MAPAPNPCTARAATSTPMVGAEPPTASPTPKRTSPTANGRRSPIRSAWRPATTIPIRLPRKNALNTHPYRRTPPSCAADDGQHGRHRQRFEGDQGHGEDQPGGQRAPGRRPHSSRRLGCHQRRQSAGLAGYSNRMTDRDQEQAVLDWRPQGPVHRRVSGGRPPAARPSRSRTRRPARCWPRWPTVTRPMPWPRWTRPPRPSRRGRPRRRGSGARSCAGPTRR